MQNNLEENLEKLDLEPKTWLNNIVTGIEKEILRTNARGELSQTPHPKKLGSALTHSHITTDYSESLLELITPPMRAKANMLDFLLDLHAWSAQNLAEDELLWCNSMPCSLPEDKLIPIAEYGSSNQGMMRHIYRKGLDLRYGRSMQTIAGIHYNFSLPESFWDIWLEKIVKADGDIATNRKKVVSAGYFNLIRNFRRYSWIILYLFGSTPNMDKTFAENISATDKLTDLGNSSYGMPYATSLRMSSLGYQNPAQAQVSVCFNSLDEYTKSLIDATSTPYAPYAQKGVKQDGEYLQLNANILQIENEFYSDIRPKRTSRYLERPSKALLRDGVEYIEVRNIDINPFILGGIDLDTSHFLDMFLLFCMLSASADACTKECNLIGETKKQITFNGRNSAVRLQTLQQEKNVSQSGLDILQSMRPLAQFLDKVHNTDNADKPNRTYSEILNLQAEKFKAPELTPSAQWLEFSKDKGFLEAGLEIARQQMQAFATRKINPANLYLFEQLTQTSLAMQAALEKDKSEDFEKYTQRYFS